MSIFNKGRKLYGLDWRKKNGLDRPKEDGLKSLIPERKKAASQEENYKWKILLYYHNFSDIYYVD